MRIILSLLAFAITFSTACKVIKYTPDKLPTRQMIFGNGGGFVGIETSYTFLENGQIFKKTGVDSAYLELKSIPTKQAKALFERLASLQLYKLDIEKPGNLYYFLREVNSEIDGKVTWGAGDFLPPQNLVSFYKDLQVLVKDRLVVKKGTTTLTEEEKKKKEEEKNLGW